MQKGHVLEFSCQGCHQSISFSVLSLDTRPLLECPQCKKKYHFGDENLKRQLHKFAALCRQLIESEEILSDTSLGIDVGHRHVKIPFKLLLTRLNSSLELMMGDQPVHITFRIEPVKDGFSVLKERL